MISTPQSYGTRGYQHDKTGSREPHDAPWGRAAREPAWSMELGHNGYPSGRLVHKNGNVMRRTGAGWKGASP